MSAEQKLELFGGEGLLESFGEFWLDLEEEPRTSLDKRYCGTKSVESLAKFKRDKASTKDDERTGQTLQIERAGVGKQGDVEEPWKGRNGGTSAGGEEGSTGPDAPLANNDRFGIKETGRAADAFPAVVIDECLVLLRAECGNQRTLLVTQCGEINSIEAGLDATVGVSRGEMSEFCSAEKDLTWNTANIHAGAAKRVLFDHNDAGAQLSSLDCCSEAGATATDDQEICIEGVRSVYEKHSLQVGVAANCLRGVVRGRWSVHFLPAFLGRAEKPTVRTRTIT